MGELLRNFTRQINDNTIDEDISDDRFVAIAMASGMSPAAIAEMSRTRNGIQIPSSKKRKLTEIVKEEQQDEEQQDEEQQDKVKKSELKKEDKGLEI